MAMRTEPTLSVRISRWIRAPRERVFEAWLDPRLRRQWWATGRPEGLSVCDIDARVGGRYCMKQVGSCDSSLDVDRNYEWVMEGEFLEIVRPERIVFTWHVNHLNEPAGKERVTIELREADGGTQLTLTHEGILSPRLRDGTEQGWSELIVHLSDLAECE